MYLPEGQELRERYAVPYSPPPPAPRVTCLFGKALGVPHILPSAELGLWVSGSSLLHVSACVCPRAGIFTTQGSSQYLHSQLAK